MAWISLSLLLKISVARWSGRIWSCMHTFKMLAICRKRYWYLHINFEVKIILNDTRPKYVLLCIMLCYYNHYYCASSSQEDFDFLSRCCKLNWIVAVKNYFFEFFILFLTLSSSNLPGVLRVSWNMIQWTNTKKKKWSDCKLQIKEAIISLEICTYIKRKHNKQIVHISITTKIDLNCVLPYKRVVYDYLPLFGLLTQLKFDQLSLLIMLQYSLSWDKDREKPQKLTAYNAPTLRKVNEPQTSLLFNYFRYF